MSARLTRRSFIDAANDVARYRQGVALLFTPGVRGVAEEIAADIRDSRPGKGVPRDKGVLAASIHVEQSGAEPVARIVAGDGAAGAYAMVQHERLDFHHSVGEARYLVRGVERWKASSSKAMEQLRGNVEKLALLIGAASAGFGRRLKSGKR